MYIQPSVWISIQEQAMERLVVQKNLFEEYLERVYDEASQSEVVIAFVWHKSVLLQKGMIASPCSGCLFSVCCLCASDVVLVGLAFTWTRPMFQLAHKRANASAGKTQW